MLLAAIRGNGGCPCPRCLVSKADIDKLGYGYDMARWVTKARIFLADLISNARRLVYNCGFSLASGQVETVLRPLSLTPTIVRDRLYFLAL